MKKYIDDYEIVVEEDEKGREKKKAVYRGNYFAVTASKISLAKFKLYNLLILVMILVSHVAGGFIDNQGMYRFYVVLPYVFTFLPLYFLTMGILRLPKEVRKLRRDEVDLSFKRVKKSSTYLVILFVVGIVGEVIFLIFFADDIRQLEYLYLGAELIGGSASAILLNIQKNIHINEIIDQN